MNRYSPHLKHAYPVTIRSSGLIGILLISLGFLFIQRNMNIVVFDKIKTSEIIAIDAIPPTHIELPKQPPRPAVPIESDDPELALDLTIPDIDIYKPGPLAPPIPDPPKEDFIAYDDPPKPLTPIRPKYPEIAQEAGIEGTVFIKVFIDKKGRVKETEILKGIPNTGLDEAAVEAIRNTRFIPAKQRERPVGVWISIPVNFRLK